MFQVPRKEKSLLVRLWQIILESKDVTSSWLPRNSELQWPMAKQLGALPRVLQDRHDTLGMTMQVNNADGTKVSMWRLTGRRRPEKSLRRVTTLTLLAWEEEKSLLVVFAWEKNMSLIYQATLQLQGQKIKRPPDCWDRPPRLWSSAPRCPAQCSASTPGVQVPKTIIFQVSKQLCSFSGVFRQELDLFHGLS